MPLAYDAALSYDCSPPRSQSAPVSPDSSPGKPARVSATTHGQRKFTLSLSLKDHQAEAVSLLAEQMLAAQQATTTARSTDSPSKPSCSVSAARTPRLRGSCSSSLKKRSSPQPELPPSPLVWEPRWRWPKWEPGLSSQETHDPVIEGDDRDREHQVRSHARRLLALESCAVTARVSDDDADMSIITNHAAMLLTADKGYDEGGTTHHEAPESSAALSQELASLLAECAVSLGCSPPGTPSSSVRAEASGGGGSSREDSIASISVASLSAASSSVAQSPVATPVDFAPPPSVAPTVTSKLRTPVMACSRPARTPPPRSSKEPQQVPGRRSDGKKNGSRATIGNGRDGGSGSSTSRRGGDTSTSADARPPVAPSAASPPSGTTTTVTSSAQRAHHSTPLQPPFLPPSLIEQQQMKPTAKADMSTYRPSRIPVAAASHSTGKYRRVSASSGDDRISSPQASTSPRSTTTMPPHLLVLERLEQLADTVSGELRAHFERKDAAQPLRRSATSPNGREGRQSDDGGSSGSARLVASPPSSTQMSPALEASLAARRAAADAATARLSWAHERRREMEALESSMAADAADKRLRAASMVPPPPALPPSDALMSHPCHPESTEHRISLTSPTDGLGGQLSACMLALGSPTYGSLPSAIVPELRSCSSSSSPTTASPTLQTAGRPRTSSDGPKPLTRYDRIGEQITHE